MKIFASPLFWIGLLGLIIGLCIGYQIGIIVGYERAIHMIEQVTRQ